MVRFSDPDFDPTSRLSRFKRAGGVRPAFVVAGPATYHWRAWPGAGFGLIGIAARLTAH